MSEAPGSTEAGLGADKGGARPGAFSILTIVAIVVALAALGFGGFMFMQLGAVKHKLAKADVPDGLQDEEHAAGHASADHGSDDSPEPLEVVYELGDFTANTADAKFVKVNLALVVKSFYPREDWENYRIELDEYEAARQHYFDYKKGAAEPEGKKGKGGHASLQPASQLVAVLSGASPALASAPKKEPEAPKLPGAAPTRPMTRLEAKMKESDARVRNIIITELNGVSSSELISLEGKAKFKESVMAKLNASFDRAYGEVVDIYFRELVTT